MSTDQPQQPTASAGPGALQATDREELEALRAATLGDYDILGELGRGGMATVYLAHDIALDRKVAIKVMSPALSLGDGVERFKREARTAASLSHPNIIPIYAVQHTDRLLYFVMKFVDGRSLDSIIKELGPLPVPMVQAILGQAASAFGYAHRRGVIHRDIKPGNILIDDEGWAIVTDFGIAKVSEAEQLTSTGLSVGTPTYMSPEQVAAQPVTGASDQYSLGVVAYEMLTGKPPFHGGGMMAMMYAHVHQPPAPLDAARPDCPEGLRAAVMRMLAKESADRWPSVEDVIAAIGSPTPTPDDPTRSQLIAIAKTGQRRAIGVTTPKSPIPLMRTPIPLSATPKTGAIATGSSGNDTPADWAAAATTAASASGPARRRASPLSLALAIGGILVGVASVAVAIRSRTAGPALPTPDTGVLPASPAPAGLDPAASAPEPVHQPTPAASHSVVRPAPPRRPADASRRSGGGSPSVAPAESAAAPPSAARESVPPPAAEAPNPVPGPASGGRPIRGAVSGAAALLGGVGSPAAMSGPSAADRKAIEAAIRAYGAALDAGSAARAREAFPAMRDAQWTYLESFFGSGGRMRTDWKISNIGVNHDQATARVRGTTQATPAGGRPESDAVDAQAVLERSSGVWRLRSLGGGGAR